MIDYASKILDMTNKGLNVFNYYLPVQFKPKKPFRNPFYDDKRASCYIYLNKKRDCYCMKDHGDGSYSGDCFWLVGLILNVDMKTGFMEILRHINQELFLGLDLGVPTNPTISPIAHPQKVTPKESITAVKPKPKRFSISKRDMTQEDIEYWGKYGITQEVLHKYNVLSLSSFSSENDNGPYTISSAPGRLMFAYVQDGFVKIYRPMDKYRFLYGGEKPRNYCFGLRQLPTSGDMVFITGGEKDVLSLASHGFSAVCFNSETADIPKDVMSILKERFCHVIIMYDADETGKAAMAKQTELWSEQGLLSVALPLAGTKEEKDISDFFRKGKTSQELKKIVGEVIIDSLKDSIMLFSSCEMDFSNPPQKSERVVTANGVPIVTCDNLTCVTGGEGSGKSHLVSAFLAGALLTEPPEKKMDALGFDVAPNTHGKAVIHFDTEQSQQELYENTMIMLRRAGLAGLPEFFHSYYYATTDRTIRLKGIQDLLSLYYHIHDGIYMVVIDGVADLMDSANDEKGSIRIIEELFKLASCYHTCIICVVHLVPNGVKLRGHIGSELQRKSSTILSVEEDDTPGCTVVKVKKLRDGNPLDVPKMLFSWDQVLDMPIFAGTKREAASDSHKRNILDIIKNVYGDGGVGYTHTELVRRVEEEADVKERTAKKYISDLYNDRTIIKRGDKYIINKNNEK